jgi:parallel beta-helix repeat protein
MRKENVMKTALLLLAMMCMPALGFSATIYVPEDYPTIQGAIDASANGDTIIVRPGTYVENIDFIGKAITLQSDKGADATIIDGGQAGSVASFENNEGPDSVLAGFTITNGTGTFYKISAGHWTNVGGGVFCVESSPIVKQNIIKENITDYGGGVGCWHSASPELLENTIAGNKADSGGGICCGESVSALIKGNKIFENDAVVGGGFYIRLAMPEVIGCLISGNTAFEGAGIYCQYGSSPTLINNILSRNEAQFEGAGAIVYDAEMTVINSTIAYNSSAIKGGGFSCTSDANLTLTNCILADNTAPEGPELWIGHAYNPSTASISYSLLKGGLACVYLESGSTLIWGPDVFTVDPAFADPDMDDYHLTYASVLCRNKGDTSIPGLPDHDFEGDPRMANGMVDIGADEFHTHLYCMGDFTPGGAIEGKFVGMPGTSPVGLFFGSGVLDPPMPTAWGNFHLQVPWLLIPLVPIPANGVLVLPATIPGAPPAPYDIPMQALIGLDADSLSNVWILEVR